MKKLLNSIIWICIPVLSGYSQVGDSLQKGKYGEGWIGIQADHTGFPVKTLSGVGIGMEYQFYKHLGVSYSFLIGETDSNDRYLYCGGGQAVFLYMTNNFKPDKLVVYMMFLTLALPESYLLYLPINESMRVSFFLSPYGFDYEKHRLTRKESYHISIELGARFQWFITPWWQVAPQIGIKKFWDSGDNAFSGGLSCLFRVSKK